MAASAGASGLSAPVSGVATPGRGGRGLCWRATRAVCGCEASRGLSTNWRQGRGSGARSSPVGRSGAVVLWTEKQGSGPSLQTRSSANRFRAGWVVTRLGGCPFPPPRRSTTDAQRSVETVLGRPPRLRQACASTRRAVAAAGCNPRAGSRSADGPPTQIVKFVPNFHRSAIAQFDGHWPIQTGSRSNCKHPSVG